MKLPEISDDERDTLLAVLDFATLSVKERLGYASNDIDKFALTLVRVKVLKLRTKLFPDLRKPISVGATNDHPETSS